MVKLCEVGTGGTVTQPAGDCTASGTGATTLALVWNALDHLNTATRTGANAIAESYAYDDSGRRISKTSGATTTSYLYDGDAIHAEWNGAISDNPAAVYVHGAEIDEPLLRLTGATTGPGATQAVYLQDGLGSVVGTTNVSGTLTANQRFDAWGVKTASSGTVPTYGFTGREPDATGMVFYRARYYHPGIARFASRDPMGMADAVSPYAYVANNPVNLIDPMGLEALLSGTPMSAAYWGMTADAGSSGQQKISTMTDIPPDTPWDYIPVLGPVAKGVGFGVGAVVKAFGDDIARLFGKGAADDAAAQGFRSFDAFKRAAGPAGQGQQWHHVVEQTPKNVGTFGPEAVHNSQNLVKVPTEIHQKISGHYSSKPPFTYPQTVREWLGTQSFDAQREYGMKILKDYGALK
ncbi:MAG: RHS repeat-associated core domain-containing protein [Thiobacillus sp.]|nr:RHS repeat-associated core domain-containing protein [Thiobacillus sp.]